MTADSGPNGPGSSLPTRSDEAGSVLVTDFDSWVRFLFFWTDLLAQGDSCDARADRGWRPPPSVHRATCASARPAADCSPPSSAAPLCPPVLRVRRDSAPPSALPVPSHPKSAGRFAAVVPADERTCHLRAPAAAPPAAEGASHTARGIPFDTPVLPAHTTGMSCQFPSLQ